MISRAINIQAEIQYGYGVNIWNLYTNDVIDFLKLDLASQIIYYLALLATKLPER